jgi:hypothetical protein
MKSSRIFLAAIAAAMLSTAGFAATPSADQVSVPAQAETKHQYKMQALFNSPDEFMMFRLQVHEATRGMPHDQKRAYRKSEFQKLKAMTGAQRDAYLNDLQAKWNTLSPDRKAHLERHMEARAAGHQGHHGGQYDQSGGQQGTPQ